MAWINVTPEGVKSPIAKFLSQEELDAILNHLKAEPGDLLCL